MEKKTSIKFSVDPDFLRSSTQETLKRTFNQLHNIYDDSTESDLIKIFRGKLDSLAEYTDKPSEFANRIKGWLDYATSDQIAEKESIRLLDQKILREFRSNNAIVSAALASSPSRTIAAQDRCMKICRITVNDKTGPISTGTGIFLTNEYVLTCWHVIYPNAISTPNDIVIRIPYHDKPLGNIITRSHIAFNAKKTAGSYTLIESRCLPEKLEEEDWKQGDNSTVYADSLDYCLLEINDTELWTIELEGELKNLKQFQHTIIFDESITPPNCNDTPPPIKFPTTNYITSDLTVGTLKAKKFNQSNIIDWVAIGDIKDTNHRLARIRYGDGTQAVKGDSGCPVANNDNQLVAIHNARTNNSQGQGIPIGYILDDIKNKREKIYNQIRETYI